MSEERTKLEVIAPSIEEAIEKGLQELGLTEKDIDVEILDEGKKGLLGLGIRQARIALKVKSPSDKDDRAKNFEKTVVASSPEPDSEAELTSLDDESDEISIAKGIITIILEKMNVSADVSVKLGDSEENRVQPIMIDIEGDDLSFLIGRKSETINALQYITSLVVSRELGRWVPLQIDVQNYRKRREDELRKLARRIAEQVETTGRRQVLEPMPANERRIVHIELRENPNVESASIGEDPRRKVTVSLKE